MVDTSLEAMSCDPTASVSSRPSHAASKVNPRSLQTTVSLEQAGAVDACNKQFYVFPRLGDYNFQSHPYSTLPRATTRSFPVSILSCTGGEKVRGMGTAPGLPTATHPTSFP